MGELRNELVTLKTEIEELSKEETLVDSYIARMQTMLHDLQSQSDTAELSYITHDDIKNLPQFQNETLLAIKAPPGTTLDVGADDSTFSMNKQYQMLLRSSGGPIGVTIITAPSSSEVLTSASEQVNPASSEQLNGLQTHGHHMHDHATNGMHAESAVNPLTVPATPDPGRGSDATALLTNRSTGSSLTANLGLHFASDLLQHSKLTNHTNASTSSMPGLQSPTTSTPTGHRPLLHIPTPSFLQSPRHINPRTTSANSSISNSQNLHHESDIGYLFRQTAPPSMLLGSLPMEDNMLQAAGDG